MELVITSPTERKTEEWIATVAIGYADGWLRRLQEFEVLINGKGYRL